MAVANHIFGQYFCDNICANNSVCRAILLKHGLLASGGDRYVAICLPLYRAIYVEPTSRVAKSTQHLCFTLQSFSG